MVMVPDEFTNCQTLPGAPKFFLKAPDAPRSSQMLPQTLACSQKLSDAPSYFQKLFFNHGAFNFMMVGK